MDSILTRIRKLRTNKGLSQEYIGEYIGLDRVRYNLIETGKRELKLDEVFKIAQALETDVSVLLHETKESNTAKLASPKVYGSAEVREPVSEYGTVDTETALLKQKVAYLEQLLTEKERIIRILEKKL